MRGLPESEGLLNSRLGLCQVEEPVCSPSEYERMIVELCSSYPWQETWRYLAGIVGLESR
jgi:hypothetical protein